MAVNHWLPFPGLGAMPNIIMVLGGEHFAQGLVGGSGHQVIVICKKVGTWAFVHLQFSGPCTAKTGGGAS